MVLITEDCLACGEDSCDWYEIYGGYETPPECTCDPNPRGRAKVVCVRVPQKPIVNKPVIIDFDVSCWVLECRKDDTEYFNIQSLIDTSNPTHRFSVPAAEYSIDLERDNSKLISKYLTIDKFTKIYLNENKKFKALCRARNYELELHKRCENILKEPSRKEGNENPHVQRKNKISRAH